MNYWQRKQVTKIILKRGGGGVKDYRIKFNTENEMKMVLSPNRGCSIPFFVRKISVN